MRQCRLQACRINVQHARKQRGRERRSGNGGRDDYGLEVAKLVDPVQPLHVGV
jgi:hypothetical protein